MGFIWMTSVAPGEPVRANQRNEEKTNEAALYAALGKNWPGNPRFPACGGAGFDMAAPCPVVWDIAVGDSIYQTPGAHPVSEFQELRDKIDWLSDNLCGTHNAAFDSGEDVGDDAGVNASADSGANSGHENSVNDYEDTAEDVSADSGANTGEDSGANSGDDVSENVGADVGANMGEDVGENVSAKSTVEVTNYLGYNPAHDFVDFIGNMGADESPHYSGDNDADFGTDDLLDLAVVMADVSCPGYCSIVFYNDH